MKLPQLGAYDGAGEPLTGSPRIARRVLWLYRSRRYYAVVLLIAALTGVTTIGLQVMASTGGGVRTKPGIHGVGRGKDQNNDGHNGAPPDGGDEGTGPYPFPGGVFPPPGGLAPPVPPGAHRPFPSQITGRCDTLDCAKKHAKGIDVHW